MLPMESCALKAQSQFNLLNTLDLIGNRSGRIESLAHKTRLKFIIFYLMKSMQMIENMAVRDGAERRRQPFQAAYYQLIPLVLQQLNFAEWPQFCDHSVTSADVRLASAPNRSLCCLPATADLASLKSGLVADQNRSPITSPLPVTPSRRVRNATCDPLANQPVSDLLPELTATD